MEGKIKYEVTRNGYDFSKDKTSVLWKIDLIRVVEIRHDV